MTVTELQKRVVQLEQSKTRPDKMVQALDCCTDEELDVLEEFVALRESGFADEEICEMMAEEKYQILVQANSHLHKRYEELLLKDHGSSH